MFGDIGKLMKMVAVVKVKLPEMKAKLAETLYTAEAGGGAVIATVSGALKLVELNISKEALAEGDPGLLADMVKAAVSAAQAKAADAASAAMKELTAGMGIDLGDLL